MGLRAFPVLYAEDVDRVADFCVRLGFEEYFRMPGEHGTTGFVGLRRDHAELAVTTEASPRVLAGVEPGPGPRHQLFVYVYVDDVDTSLTDLRAAGATVLREPVDMSGASGSPSCTTRKATSSRSRCPPAEGGRRLLAAMFERIVGDTRAGGWRKLNCES